MIPIISFSSLLFGNWPLKWNEKNQKFEICYYFFFTSIFMFIYFCYSFSMVFDVIIKDDSIVNNPQYFIISLVYLNPGVLVINRLMNVRNTVRFANELKNGCGRTVESGRHLPEFWLRTAGCVVLLGMVHYKYRIFAGMPTAAIMVSTTIPLGCCMYCGSTMECQYAAACGALARSSRPSTAGPGLNRDASAGPASATRGPPRTGWLGCRTSTAAASPGSSGCSTTSTARRYSSPPSVCVRMPIAP
ncbi:uncharacterized protein LOC112599259 [Melanaphis sacchari]|uniref:uncharacterized protein LOC112599259 n=1 Tax=Melanaphis sacchari TaxID=742174 RepID=UPI000DC154A9|nr:uncharacterized protein LOC112599259 [Melanaphis sacchari]